MARFRVVVELDSYDRISAMAAVNGCFALASSGGVPPMGIKVMKSTQIRGPKHKKGWRASHDARFVKPSSEFGGQRKYPWLADAACESDDIGPIFKRRKDALRSIRVMMSLGNRHGWSQRRRDYSITKVV